MVIIKKIVYIIIKSKIKSIIRFIIRNKIKLLEDKILKILSFFNIKGGIGKTTLTTLVAYKLSSEGKKILIIDADLQANLTQNIYKSNHTDKTMVNAIEGATAEELIIKAPNPKYPGVDLIPSDIELCILAENMALVEDKNLLVAKWFKRNMNTLREYDYIFVDLSPSIDLLNRNFIYVLDGVIIPMSHGDLASIKGAELFNKLYQMDMKKLGIEDNCKKAVLLNNNKSYKRKMLELFDKQLEQYKFSREHVLNTKLSDSTTIQQATVLKVAISDLSSSYKNKKIEKQIDDLIEELKEKEIL